MNLTESQLFTIEALNRIEGFVWPERAKFAKMDDCVRRIYFYAREPELSDSTFNGDFLLGLSMIKSESIHPDWRNSLITREQFESVDGWVRGKIPKTAFNIEMILFGANESDVKWRYHKTTKEAEMNNPETKRPTLLKILVLELPRRGGWPKGALFMVQDNRGFITHFSEHTEARCIDGNWYITSDNELGDPFPVSMLSCDYSTKIVNRYEYLIEAAKAHDNICFIADDECKPQKKEATTEKQPKSLDQLFAERKKMMADISVTRSNLSIINYEIKALLTAQGWTK